MIQNRRTRRTIALALLAPALLVLPTACGPSMVAARMSTGADLSLFTEPEPLSDPLIREAVERRPTARFPATLAIVRVQAPREPGAVFDVVAVRDIETDEDLSRLEALPSLEELAPLNAMILPRRLTDERALRTAAAAAHADLLLIYTIDTKPFDREHMRPLSVFSLGLIPTRNVEVRSTAAAALLDAKTGYLYGVSEANASTEQLANAWTSNDAIEQATVRAEHAAFIELIDDFERTWTRVVEEHGAG